MGKVSKRFLLLLVELALLRKESGNFTEPSFTQAPGRRKPKRVSCPAKGASLPRREPRQRLTLLITRKQGCRGLGAGVMSIISEDEIKATVSTAFQRGLVVEPAGTAALAAVLTGKVYICFLINCVNAFRYSFN